MSSEPGKGAAVTPLVVQLETLSRERPDRVLRLTGSLPSAEQPGLLEPCELVLFRGFSSSTTHPTAFDPDQLVLPDGATLSAATLLAGPLNPACEQVLAGPAPPETFLDPRAWC